MAIALIVLHVLVGVFLIAVVLLQSGKAGSIADVFGGGGSMAAFGARGAATVLSRVTTITAIIFMITSLGLSLMKSQEASLMKGQTPARQQQGPASPTTPPKSQPQQQPQQQQPANPPSNVPAEKPPQ